MEEQYVKVDEVVITGTKTFKRQTESAVIVGVMDSKAIENDPTNIEYLLDRALFYSEINEIDKSQKDYEQILKIKPDYYLALPWHFQKEFMKRERLFLKNGGKFIFPLPQIRIIK